MKPEWARNLVTGLARFDGRPAGIVANQPMFLGGALDVNAADKAARFVWLCDAFNIPLVFLMDVLGSWSARRSRSRGSSGTAPRCCSRWRGHGAEGDRGAAQGLRRRVLRDERAGVRARLIVGWPTAEIA